MRLTGQTCPEIRRACPEPGRRGALAGALVLAALVAGPLLGAAQQRRGLVENLGKGLIDWSAGYVEAEGAGVASGDAPSAVVARLGAERAAKADAYRNLLETVQGVRVQGESVVENFMTASDTVRTQVSGIVRGAVETGSGFDGQVATVRLRMPLWGELAGAVYEVPGGLVPSYTPFPAGSGNPRRPGGGMRGLLEDLEGRAGALLRRFARLFAPGSALAAEPSEPPLPVASEITVKEHSGLIIDLTKTRMRPDLFPKIVDAGTDKVLVDARAAGLKTAAAGAVGYAGSLEQAREQRERIGADPLVMEAVNFVAGTSDGWKVDFASGMGLDTARGLVTDPGEILKQGVTIAYRIGF